MKIYLKTLKFKAKQELVDFVDDKVGKLFKFDDKIISAEVNLSLDNPNVTGNKVCEIRLIIPGNDDFVKKNAPTFEEAILSSVDILQKVMQRRKAQATIS